MYPFNTSYRCDDRLRVTDVSWERIFMDVEIESDYDEDLRFTLGRVIFPKQVVVYEDDTYDSPNGFISKRSVF